MKIRLTLGNEFYFVVRHGRRVRWNRLSRGTGELPHGFGIGLGRYICHDFLGSSGSSRQKNHVLQVGLQESASTVHYFVMYCDLLIL